VTCPFSYVNYDSIKTLTLSEIGKKLESLIPSEAIKDTPFHRLCCSGTKPNGVYLFYGEDNALWYVGKSTSRSFIERIPAHFDLRETAWLNTLPKKISMKEQIAYDEAHKKALSLRLVRIGMDAVGKEEKRLAGLFESLLRQYLQPKLNPLNKQKEPCDEAAQVSVLLDERCGVRG